MNTIRRFVVTLCVAVLSLVHSIRLPGRRFATITGLTSLLLVGGATRALAGAPTDPGPKGYFSIPNFGALSGFAPITSVVIGLLGAFAVIGAIVFILLNLLKLLGSGRDRSKHEDAMAGIKNGIIVFVVALILVPVCLIVYNITKTVVPA